MADESWKHRTMIAGGVLGTLIGVGAALLYVRGEEESMQRRSEEPIRPKGISPAAALPIAIGLLGVLRQIADLADRD